jgi:hypothetical protein
MNSGDSPRPAASRRRRGATEIRLDDRGQLDEVVAWGFIHLERMDTGHWWLGIDTVDGKRLMVNLCSRRRNRAVDGRAEFDGASGYATPLLPAVRVAIAKERRRINRNRRRMGWPTLKKEGL